MDLRAVLVAPFADMAAHPAFLVEVLIGGIAAGLMYSLVALGLRADLQGLGRVQLRPGRAWCCSRRSRWSGSWSAARRSGWRSALTMAVMVALAFAIERVVLRPLVNQEPIILFMATIGLNFFLEGFGEMAVGRQRQEARHRHPRHARSWSGASS